MALYDPNSPPETKVLVYDFYGNPPRFIETNYNTARVIADYDRIDLWDAEKRDLRRPFWFCPSKYGGTEKELYHRINLWKYEEVEKWVKEDNQPLRKILFVKSTPWKRGPGVDERVLAECEESTGLTLEASMEWNKKYKELIDGDIKSRKKLRGERL